MRSKYADSHLDYVFDWPQSPVVPLGRHYCINSAALRFMPADSLKEAGYGECADLFQ